MTNNQLAVAEYMPIMGIQQARERYQAFKDFVESIMRPGVDYGVIPGTQKPTLLKPGAEKLATFFGLSVHFEKLQGIEDWTGEAHGGEPFFYYWYRCLLTRNGYFVADAEASCNSREKKYRWRSGERKCPSCGQPAIIKGRAEYGGGWVCFAKKGGCGTKFRDDDAAITGQQTGRVVNEDIADAVNTIQKMAQKRALVAATLIGTNASEYFTQDFDDFITPEEVGDMAFDKVKWQREHRAEFKQEHGYNEQANYATGGLRDQVLKRDNYACVLCGMTDAQHKAKWNKPITIDHINKDRTENTMENLQTLCLSCHGRKDQKPELREPQIVKFKQEILDSRSKGETYQVIADRLGCSIACVWKWCQRWAELATIDAGFTPAPPSAPEPKQPPAPEAKAVQPQPVATDSERWKAFLREHGYKLRDLEAALNTPNVTVWMAEQHKTLDEAMAYMLKWQVPTPSAAGR